MPSVSGHREQFVRSISGANARLKNCCVEPSTRTLKLPSLLSSLLLTQTTIDSVDLADDPPDNNGLSGQGGLSGENTQIYEGTNQVQRVVVAKHLLK